MNKVTTIAVSALAAFVSCCPPNFAQAANSFFIGNYKTFCNTQGLAVSDTRNAQQQQVVHLQAQGDSQSQAYIHNSAGSQFFSVPVTAPIQFTVQRGNANRLEVIVLSTAPGDTMATPTIWVSPTTALPRDASVHTLAQLGNVYSIPVGGTGMPLGSTLNMMYFNQHGNANNCNSVVSNINQIGINGAAAGIDATPGATCGADCQ